MLSDWDIARVGYEAYSAATGGKSIITGDPLPDFATTKPEVQGAWVEAAKVMRNVLESVINTPEASPLSAQAQQPGQPSVPSQPAQTAQPAVEGEEQNG